MIPVFIAGAAFGMAFGAADLREVVGLSLLGFWALGAFWWLRGVGRGSVSRAVLPPVSPGGRDLRAEKVQIEDLTARQSKAAQEACRVRFRGLG